MLRQIDKFITWNAKMRRYDPVLWRREILPSWLTIRDTDATLPLTIPVSPGTPPLTIFQPYTSVNGADQGLGTPFEVRSLVYQDSTDGTDSADFSVFLQEVGEARQFMNQPIHIKTLAGTGALPAVLREPYMFLSQHNISAKFVKLSGGSTTARFYMCGAQYFPWSPMMTQYPAQKKELTGLLQKWMERRKYVTPFWMTADNPNGLVTIPALVGSTATAQVKVGDDGHFECFGHCAHSTGNFSFQASEAKTNQRFQNGEIDQVNGFGDARFPTIYPTPYLLPAGYVMKLFFKNLIAGVNNVNITFFGRKIYAPIKQVAEVLRSTAVPTPADSASQMVPAPLL